MAVKLQWRPVPADEVPDVTNLPPLDYALFLFSTVKFYFGFLSFMIDEESYLRHLYEFYENSSSKAASSRYWYAQYLLVLAFGKAFLTARNPSGTPPGHQYASRAMSLLPDLSGMHEDPLTCIQALSLGAVYLQSIDMRRAAFQHIGQALRGCIIEGIHRHVPEELCGPELSSRCRTIFWVVYMLDREFSALIGAPSSIRDEDISVRLPAEMENSVEHSNLTLHVRLSRLMAQTLTTVYGVGDEFNGTLIRNTQSILHSMAELSHDLTAFLNQNFHGLISRASKMAIRLMLAHHHCCADSAQTILQTLQTLADDDLMGKSTLEFLSDNPNHGNPAAPLRRQELRQLEQILAPLTPKSNPIPLPSMNVNSAAQDDNEFHDLDNVDVEEAFEWDLLGLNSSVSLPPQELLDLADQLDVESIMQSVGGAVG
ncbi:unnamed protein product [Penicillium pancosmium]